MMLSSRASQILALGFFTAYLSLPFTYSLVERDQHISFGASLSDELVVNNKANKKHSKKSHLVKTHPHYNKKETARMIKTVHHHNARHYKREKIKKSSKVCRDTHDPNQSEKNTRLSYHSKTGKFHSNQSSNYDPTPHGRSALVHLTSACGKANPTSSSTVSSGPNGSQSFLNCGITGNGWNPPAVKMSMLQSLSLDQEPAKTTFAPCSQFRSLFEKYGNVYDIPPIFLAAFAMQESTCRPDVIGDQGGAFGLMQITKDKCGDAPDGNCRDPDYNIKIGAKTFADGLKETNGNVLIALGAYNGWTTGLTKTKALEAKDNGCCVCQQNLDYLHQYLNGWIQGIDPHTHGLGTMRNLDVCGDQS